MTWLRRLATFEGVSRDVLKVAAWVSIIATLVGLYQGWAAWAVVSAAVVPWFVPLSVQTWWLREHYGWFALFYLLFVTQLAHYVEHIVQFVQNHVLGQGLAASGVITVLNVEGVHFAWNTVVFLAAVALVFKFRRNPWLWAVVVVALWHQIEHTYTIVKLVETGMEGHGLLGENGRLSIAIPITGQDLHQIYNTVETLPLIAAFFYQVARTRDTWLERAFPTLGADALTRLDRAARSRPFAPDEVIVRKGLGSEAIYVVVRGELEVELGEGAGSVRLGPGRYFGETVLLDAAVRTATVRARTAGELLEMDASTFREILDDSPEAAEDLRQLALHRAAGP